jgi:ribosomal protein S18 acetylase RimI-like enzyme
MPEAVCETVLIDQLPRSFPRFIDEMAHALADVYGPAGAREYRRHALQWGARAVADPASTAQAAIAPDSGEAIGLVMSRCAGTAGQLTFVHVLAPWTGRGVEHGLVDAAITALEHRGARRITSECLPLCPLDLDPPFAARGFQALPRLFMTHLLADACRDAPATSAPAGPADHAAAATVLAAAYRDHGDARLLEDVRDTQAAGRFLAALAAGAYGQADPDWLRVAHRDGFVVGVAAGCRIAEGLGFVMQMAVHPDWQGRGIGEALMRDLLASFRARGMERVALGVTAANPARRLYERLGFATARAVTAYYRDR